MKLLMHTCCAPCSVYCIDSLRSENIEPTVYWFNPNIHPYQEYKARRDTLKQYTASINIDAVFEENYGLRDFCKNVVDDLGNRCSNYCYPVRLEQTAKYAKENGFDKSLQLYLLAPTKNMILFMNLEIKLQMSMALIFYIGTLELALERDKIRLENLDFICKNIVGVFFQRR